MVVVVVVNKKKFRSAREFRVGCWVLGGKSEDHELCIYCEAKEK